MAKRTFDVVLGPLGAVGTVVTVTTKRFLRKPVIEHYMCTRSGMVSTDWRNIGTGESEDYLGGIAGELDDAAQAAVEREKVKILAEMNAVAAS